MEPLIRFCVIVTSALDSPPKIRYYRLGSLLGKRRRDESGCVSCNAARVYQFIRPKWRCGHRESQCGRRSPAEFSYNAKVGQLSVHAWGFVLMQIFQEQLDLH